MIKVTPNDNLVPCKQLPSENCIDLTQNLHLARTLIRGATQFFHLARNRARFCGYVEREPGELRFELKYKGKVYRVVRFPDIGYAGLLIIEIPVGAIQHTVGSDILGDLYGAEFLTQFGQLEMEIEGHRLIPALTR